jgi:flagellar biosynthesis GTPase FlhF
MCNPRRVRVTVTRRITADWRRDVTRLVQRGQEVRVHSTIRRGVGEGLSLPALAMVPSVMDEDPNWQQVEGGYRHDIGDGCFVVYDPESRELEITVDMRSNVEVTGQAHREVSGSLGVTLSETAGSDLDVPYYEYRRRQSEARQEAQRQLEQAAGREQSSLDEQAARRADREEEAAVREVQAEARREADRRLAEQARAEQQRLQEQLQPELERVAELGRRAFLRVARESLERAIRAWAAAHDVSSDDIRRSEDGDTVELEFLVSR